MSPDNWKNNPVVAALQRTHTGIITALPNLGKFFVDDKYDFESFTIFVGDTNDYVCGVRTYDLDGLPIACWGSGPDVLSALISLDTRCGNGSFKPDKKRMTESQVKALGKS